MKRFTLVVLLAALPLLASRAEEKPTRLAPSEADVERLLGADFYGVYMLGKKVGYGKNSLAKLDGARAGYVSVVEFSAKLTAAGVKTELQSRTAYEFDPKPPYALRSAVSRETDGRTVKETTLTRTDKGFDVVVNAGGEKTRKHIDAPDYTLADALTVNLWLAKGPKVGDTITSRAFDLEDLKVDREVRKMLGSKTAAADGVKVTYHEVEVTFPKEGLTGLERFDEKGEKCLSMKIAGALEMRVEPEEQAKNTEFAGDLFEMGKVKVSRKLGDAEKVTGLVLETVGKDELALKSGPRQSVTRNESGTYTLKLGKAHGVEAKATDKEVQDALEETGRYPITHPKVRELAQRAVGDAKTPEEKVKRLVTFVADYIKPSYTAQPLNLMDLLKARKGDCSEYALLFTALARAAGVPARELSGLVYLGDDEKAFGFHAWNEVVLDGKWVPVDASADETEINATHISFGSLLGESITNIFATFGKLSLKVIEVNGK